MSDLRVESLCLGSDAIGINGRHSLAKSLFTEHVINISVCVLRRSHGSEVSGRIEGIGGIGGIGMDRNGSEGSLPIVRDRKRSEGSEKFKNVRGFGYNRKLGNWKFEI